VNWISVAELRAERTEAGVAAAVASGMRLEDQVGSDRLVEACAVAFGAPTLLILDNCEHMIDDAAELVPRHLDTSTPRVRTTSVPKGPPTATLSS
jgi:predicted ATPase